MAKRKDEREEEQDRGTKADHGIGRPDAEMENRATKAGLGDQNDTEWLKDPKAELTGGNDTEWIKDPKADIVDPVHTEGADLLDTATVPQFQEGPESIDAENEDADWDDDAPEMEVEVDIEEDVDTHADVDTFEEVDAEEDDEM